MPSKILSILFADDDPEDIELFQEAILRVEPNTKLTTVSNGKEVIDLLAGCKTDELPDLLVLDYNMPQMTGAEVLSELKGESRYRSIIKLIVSTSGSEMHKNQCLANGAKDYFVKPSNMKELEFLVRKMLEICKAG